MKISIVTVYESMNCGAYLQAWALKEFLENYGHQVTYLENNSRNIEKFMIRYGIKLFLKRKMQDLKMEMKNYSIFRSYHKNFKMCPYIKKNMKEQDLFILGSDEIWNVSKRDMAPFPIFWGDGIQNDNIISYAPSANNATLEDIKNYPYAKVACEKLKKISVRDTYTKKLIESITEKPVTLVCDPTMLLDEIHYNSIIKNCEHQDFILIYDCYKKFSTKEIKMCKAFAEKQNKKLISFGAYLSWCDISLPADPMNYLSYIKAADYIFTGTFHGTIYSIIFNKQFVLMGNPKNKVKNTLKYYDLEDRVLISKERLSDSAPRKINYKEINKKVEEMRNQSKNFLLSSLTT